MFAHDMGKVHVCTYAMAHEKLRLTAIYTERCMSFFLHKRFDRLWLHFIEKIGQEEMSRSFNF